MNAHELIKFLKLLRDTSCIDNYWKNRINRVIKQMGGAE